MHPEGESHLEPNVYLVGPMGVGKTTIGRMLSHELKFRFVDTDKEVELRTGADIPWIFDVEGELGFRQREMKALEEVSLESGQVIATGGGIILMPENREIIKKSPCIYLRAELDQLVSRIGRDKKRPLLQNDDPRSILSRLLQVRDPLYREVARWVVQTDSRPPRQVVREITAILRKADVI